MENEIKDDLLNEEQVKAITEVAKNPQNAVRYEVTNKVSEKLRQDEGVKKRVEKTAENVVEAGLTNVENEVAKTVSESNADKLQAYFDEHKEELETAGITEKTYMEDMERAVKWHKKCANFHWIVCGWWMTLIKTFILKAKPFKVMLNLIGILLNTLIIGLIVYLSVKVF